MDRWTTTGFVGLLALIASTVSYLHLHLLMVSHGQPGWVAVLTSFSVDGMIVAASMALLADSRSGSTGGLSLWVVTCFGDPILVLRAGLVPVMSLAERAGLGGLVRRHVQITAKTGVYPDLKVACLVAGMVAGVTDVEFIAVTATRPGDGDGGQVGDDGDGVKIG